MLVVKKVKDILGSVQKSGGSRLREVILSLSPGETNLSALF